MKKIAIHISTLNNNIWRLIFGLFDLCHHKESWFGEEDFVALLNAGADIRYHNDIRPIDAVCPYGASLTYELLRDEIKRGNIFFISIVCKKNDDSTNNPNILPIISWFTDDKNNNSKNDISLGIDISSLDNKTKDRYKYRLGQQLQLIKDIFPSPSASKRCLYYIDVRKDFSNLISYDFPYRKSSGKAPVSRHFLPFLSIRESLYKSFSNSNNNNDVDIYLRKSIEQLNNKLKGIDNSQIKSCSPFEEWLIKAYLFHLKSGNDKDIVQIYENNKTRLHEYYFNIYELIQNVIFHTESKTGELSLSFVKKCDIKDELRNKIPHIEKYLDTDCFLEFELSDDGDKGIVETYNDKSLSLLSFFDPTEILLNGNEHLTLRYAAHLGIKSFVSSVINSEGYFYVESNSSSGGKSRLESRGQKIVELDKINNGQNGTRYRVVLPIATYEDTNIQRQQFMGEDGNNSAITIPKVKKQSEFLRIQSGSITNKEGYLNNMVFQLCNNTIEVPNKLIVSKDEQISIIKEIANDIIKVSCKEKRNNIGIDMSKYNRYSPNLIFKLIAYLRLNIPIKNQLETIVCYNLEDTVYDKLLETVEYHNMSISKKRQPIWSEECAIVLMTESRIQILCGETIEAFHFVNEALSRYYTFPKIDEDDNSKCQEREREKLLKFIRPYDVYVGSPSKFINDVQGILKKEIEDVEKNNSGCLVNIPARLGEKVYIDNFYQSDHLFQQSYYAERFALIIARGYCNSFIDQRKKSISNNVILLSYNPYSKLLTEYVKKYLESLNIRNDNSQIKVKYIVTGIDNPETNEMQFDISGDKIKKIDKKTVPDDYSIITIVPIATTLTTFEKLINNFQCFCKESQININPHFEYNHCSILIRDQDCPTGKHGCTSMELEWNWMEIDDKEKIVKTTTKTIHYLVAMATRWHHLIDENTFPTNYWDEIFILRTHNSSLNVNNILGYPDLLILQDFSESQKRLEELKDFIYGGHIIHNNKHHRYYFDIPRYIEKYENKNTSELQVWVSGLNIEPGRTNIIVTSEPDKDPQLTTFIKESLFKNRAHVLFLDLHDRNIKYKYSFIQLLPKGDPSVKYYFIDQALLTGNAYYTAKSQMASILSEPGFKFDNIITIINRLSETKYKEILEDLNTKDSIHSFIQFLIPPSKIDGSSCYICNMETFFMNLKEDSVIKDCRSIIESNKNKYKQKDYAEVKKEKRDTKNFERFYKRMIWQNRLFYEISKTYNETNYEINKEKAVAKGKKVDNREFVVNKKIYELYDESKEKIDDHISFIKAISTPPISDYARIRKIAFRILLEDLRKVLEKKQPRINDLFLLKVLLRHLALLESNALVRRDVISGTWDIFEKIKSHLLEEIREIRNDIKKIKEQQEDNTKEQMSISFEEKNIDALEARLYDIYSYISERPINNNTNETEIVECINDRNNKLNQFPNYLLFYIKIATHKDPSKSLWLGELLRTGRELDVNNFNNSFNISRTKLFNELFKQEGIGTSNTLLPYLFYENTTIIRKTLDSFQKYSWDVESETVSDNNKEQNEGVEIVSLEKQIEDYKRKIKENYNYYWFQWYFPIEKHDGSKYRKLKQLREKSVEKGMSIEGIPLIEKYALVLNAKNLLTDLSDSQKSKVNTFDKNADRLLESFTNIMDAQASYITIKSKLGKYYTLSVYNNGEGCIIDRDRITYDNSFYCKKLLDDCDNTTDDVKINRGRPFVMRKKLQDQGISYGESFNKYEQAAFLTLEYNDQTIGLVTFLYKSGESNNLFWRKTQEYGRLLLLLKPELDHYVRHVANDKQFEEWIRNQHLSRLTYAENHGLDLAGWDFDNLPEKEYVKIYNGIVTLSNVVVRHLYAMLMNEHEIKLSSEQIMLSEIFDKKFKLLLNEISNNILHGMQVEFDALVDDTNVTIWGLKPVFQSYIIQLLFNSDRHANSRHTYIHFFDTYFEIVNDIWTTSDIESINSKFKKKYNEKSMDSFVANPQHVDEYGFTLITLYYYIKSLGMRCLFEFKKGEINYFSIKIYYSTIK